MKKTHGQLWKIASCSRARVGTLSERSDSKWARWAIRTWLTPQNSVHTTQKQLDNMHGQSWLVPGLGQLCILSWAKGDATGDRINTVTMAAPLQCITVYFSVGRQTSNPWYFIWQFFSSFMYLSLNGVTSWNSELSSSVCLSVTGCRHVCATASVWKSEGPVS